MPRPLDRRTLIHAALVGAVTVLAACTSDRGSITAPPMAGAGVRAPSASPPGDGAIESVAMIGDSITVGSQTQLAEAFISMGLDVRTIDAAEGRRIATGSDGLRSGVDAALALTSRTPVDLWVVALGTNDVAKYKPEEYAAVIGELLAVVPPDAPLVWVDVYLDDAFDESSAFNSALNGVLAGRQRTTVAPWSAVAGGDGVLADGIHPSDAGRSRFAEVVSEAVGALTG